MSKEHSEYKLCIIIPTYNSSKNIKKMLESIDLENNQFIKVIIVDDNSNMEEFLETLDIARNYPQKQIEIVKNNSLNKGAGSCRNIGLRLSKEDWVIFADSDDHFIPGYNEIIFPFLHTNFDMIYFLPTSTDENNNVGNRHDGYAEYFSDYFHQKNDLSLRYKLPVVWSRIYNRNFLFDNSIIFEETIVSNDRMFAAKSGYLARKIFVSNEIIYSWDYNNNSLTTKMSKERFLVNLFVNIRVNSFYKKNLTSKEFSNVKETITKFFALSLIRYRFGLRFSFKILFLGLKNGMSLVRFKDFERIRNFFKNNNMYKRSE
ncbi:hypothetical protein IGK74_001343 [Enterococcus sp. AZ150]|uniref:Glycosyltransferase 2-like domain-containing protein n=1 Tax=Enterococcus sulfureus ATCC 49903 TaxID=1140003 RepID=S0PA80_9ENTE|nr:glycosyltransferase family 2 protein [Enterococcus sulfureus]EOT49313.1 hypothetical protein OMY_00241 [Enterococcus sulfureus ATCC 49903]EOT87180.1 hypothetical protein I573_00236 [Enterococcus sulfureus ATCC 49903]